MHSSPQIDASESLRAIVCDADEISARMLSRALRGVGFLVLTCATAAACEAAVAAEQPHLVVLSLLLPDLDGLALARRLRSRYPDLRLVMVSALRAEQRALQMGADAFLAKPVPAGALTDLAVSLTAPRAQA